MDKLYADLMKPGKNDADIERNYELLKDYDYSKYVNGDFTGYYNQDLQKISICNNMHAVRTRVGQIGNYKGAIVCMPDGKLVIGVCIREKDTNFFNINIWESNDTGVTWTRINETSLYGKEPSLTVLSDATLILTVQSNKNINQFPDNKKMPVYISKDGGRNWSTREVGETTDYPRNLIVEKDGSILMIRAERPDWGNPEHGSPNFQIARSYDKGNTWEFSTGEIDWNYSAFGEISSIRLKNGNLISALRSSPAGLGGHGSGHTLITESRDDGRTWSKPKMMSNTGEVHTHLMEREDGSILATYTNYHLPWGAFAIISKDCGKTWNLDQRIQLSISAEFYGGWPVTVELNEQEYITCYAVTNYLKQTPSTSCEVVRWKM